MGTPFKARGAFTDEAITVMRTLWNDIDSQDTWTVTHPVVEY